MPAWNSGTVDISYAELATSFVVARVPGAPDVMKELPISSLLYKDAANIYRATVPSSGYDVPAFRASRYGYSSSYKALVLGDVAGGENVTVCVGFDPFSIASGSFVGNGSEVLFRNGVAFMTPNAANNGFHNNVFVMKDGKVGIGVGSPVRPLDVNGEINIPVNKTYRVNDKPVLAAGATVTYIYSSGAGGILFRNSADNLTTLNLDDAGNLLPGVDGTKSLGWPTARWGTVYAATGTINTSDERSKTPPEAVPDAWLDAWGDVEWSRFKFIDGTRWHVGLIAQKVHAAFKSHGLDAFEIGLCCYDRWDEQREPIFETATRTRPVERSVPVVAGEADNGTPLYRFDVEIGTEEYDELVDTGKTRVVLEAGDRWGLRYDECQAIEAAYQRRRMARIEARLAEIEVR